MNTTYVYTVAFKGGEQEIKVGKLLMNIKRTSTIDQFSTFLILSDTTRNIFIWEKDLQLKLNIEKTIGGDTPDPETIAFQFLNSIKSQHHKLLTNHLTSYLQEACYWSARKVFIAKKSAVNLLTLEECFSSGNEAVVQPVKILKNYKIEGGSKITTYAQLRLKTIIGDAIYRHRQWKLSTNWGLLKKVGKSKRKLILQQAGGLDNDLLNEYLLLWQCYVDLANSNGKKNKHNSLSAPKSPQIKLINQQYNLLLKKYLSNSSKLSEEDCQKRLEFCGEKARIFINPQTTSYEEQIENSGETVANYDLSAENNLETAIDINQILEQGFENLDIKFKAIIYLYLGLNITQQQVVNIMKTNYPDFISQQYQFSRKLNKAKKDLLTYLQKDLSQSQNKNKNQKISTDIKILLKLIQQWLEEYIEAKIIFFFHQLYEQLDSSQQLTLKNDYYQQKLANNSHINKFISSLRNTIENNLEIKLPIGETTEIKETIDQNLNLLLEKYLTQTFNKIS